MAPGTLRAINSIRARLHLLALLALVPVGAQFGHAALVLDRVGRASEVTANLELAQANAAAFREWVRSVSRTALPVADAIASRRLSEEEATALLQRTEAQFTAVRELAWAAPDGTLTLSSERAALGENVGADEWFGRLAAGEEAVVSDLLPAHPRYGETFVIARALRDPSRRLVGAVVAVIDRERLGQKLLSTERIGDADFMLLDRSGRVVLQASPIGRSSPGRDDLSAAGLVRRALSGQEATGVSRDGEEEWLGAAAPVADLGWAVHARRGAEEALGPVHREIGHTVLVALGAAALSLAASTLVGGRIAASLRRLERHAEALGRGERVEPPTASAPEIARLARAYGAMAARVRDAHDRLDVLRRAGVVLSESLDVDEVARRIARFAVPALADWCAIEELAPDGVLRPLAVAHGGGRTEPAHGAREAYRPDPRSPTWRAIAERRAVHAVGVAADGLADGSELAALVRRAPVRSCVFAPLVASGSVLGVAAFAVVGSGRSFEEADVRLLEELARRAAQAIANARLFGDAQRAIRSRDEVLSIVSHDLRNPLGAVMLGARFVADLPERSDVLERARAAGRRMLSSAERMSRLIGDLLDLASLRSGRLAMSRRTCAPADLVRDACEESRGAAREKGLEFTCELGPAVPDVSCDPGRALQVLGNLASNAIKSTETGEVRLAAYRGDREVVFSVSDTGPGIPADEQARLFEPFRRGPGVAYRGTGLGLAIARALVEAQRGRIWIESRAGEGTTVSFTLPACGGARAPRDGGGDQAGGVACPGAIAAAGRRPSTVP